MRGKQRSSVKFIVIYRITPADAGKTEIGAETYGLFKDHPRGCGENSTTGGGMGSITGSPPRMRGKH